MHSTKNISVLLHYRLEHFFLGGRKPYEIALCMEGRGYHLMVAPASRILCSAYFCAFIFYHVINTSTLLAEEDKDQILYIGRFVILSFTVQLYDIKT